MLLHAFLADESLLGFGPARRVWSRRWQLNIIIEQIIDELLVEAAVVHLLRVGIAGSHPDETLEIALVLVGIGVVCGLHYALVIVRELVDRLLVRKVRQWLVCGGTCADHVRERGS